MRPYLTGTIVLACLLGILNRETSAARPGPAAVTASAVSCTYGGAVPAYFVMLDLATTQTVTGIHALKYEIEISPGMFHSGSVGPVALREMSGTLGTTTPGPVPATIPAGSSGHYQLFGQLDLSIFGARATYPNSARNFRATLAWSGGGTLVVTGRCRVGPAG